MSVREPVRTIGRYALFGEIAAGGMAAVHLGRLVGPAGFSRTVAIKRLHAHFAKDPEFVSMFLDEARLAARIRHPNVVPTLDVVALDGELFLVMEYVPGESLSRLMRAAHESKEPVPLRIAVAIMVGVLQGLHAAHESKSEKGESLDLVHRDVSPQNVLVGADGVPRVLDFGVAKAVGRSHTTRDGKIKGKLAYMAPEQFDGTVTRRVDVYASAVVLWEVLTSRRLFAGENEGATISRVLHAPVKAPSTFRSEVSSELDAVVLRGLDRDASKRFATAREMSVALERSVGRGGMATASETSEWLEQAAHEVLAQRAGLIAEVEGTPSLSNEPSQAHTAPADRASSETDSTPAPSKAVDEEVSSLSIARPASAPPSARRRTLAVGIAIGFIFPAIAFLFWNAHHTSTAPASSAASSPFPSATPDVSSQPTSAATASSEAMPLPSASSSSIASAPPVRHTHHATTSAPSGNASNCDPDYTFENGIKIYKPECFKK